MRNDIQAAQGLNQLPNAPTTWPWWLSTYAYNPNIPHCLVHGYGHWTKEHVSYERT